MKPGESQVWSIVDMGNDPHYDVAFINNANQAAQVMWVVAADGEPLTRPEPVTDLKLSPGKRYSFIVSVPNTAAAGSTFSFRQLGFFDGDGQWPATPLTTVKVQGSPVTPFQIPQQLTPPHNAFHDLSNEPITEHRVAVFDQNPEQGPSTFSINGQTFPNPPVFQARIGTTEEWTIKNMSHSIHVFHTHQNNFQIMSMNGVRVPADGTPVVIPNVSFPPTGTQNEILVGGGLEDVVDIPAFNPVTNQPGEVVLRMQFKDFTGKYVYHCHIVDHEDNGMMAIVNVSPNDPVFAVGAGENAPPLVHVYDSLTGNLKTSFLAFDPQVVTGGVSVAVANLFGDNRQQIIVGAGPGSLPLVRVFDENGTPLPGILGNGFLAFSDLFRGGVNVAAGDLDSDGIQEIIVGEGAALNGEPRIRAFDVTNGSTLLDFLAFESSFHGGVRVAAGDVVGNGRVQIIAGRGPGSTPEVKVFRADTHVMADVLAFDQTFHGGVFVATGWVKGFAYQDVIVGAGPGLSLVRVLSNLSPQDNGANDSVTLTQWNQVSVAGFTTGLHVGSSFDASGSGDDLLAAPGPFHSPTVSVFRTGTLAPVRSFQAFGSTFTRGVNFGAIDRDGDASGGAGGAGGGGESDGLAGQVVSLIPRSSVRPPWSHGPHPVGHGVGLRPRRSGPSPNGTVVSGDYADLLLLADHWSHTGGIFSAGGATGDLLLSGYGSAALLGATGVNLAGHLLMTSSSTFLGTMPARMAMTLQEATVMPGTGGDMKPG
jgi:hypothetical protein